MQATQPAIDVRIGPHTARDGWRVLRVAYVAEEPDHARRVAVALNALLAAGPPADTGGRDAAK